MELNISGLKCDFCAYRDDEVEFSEYEASIGKSCPKCGESLLTQDDYDRCLRMYKMVSNLNKISDVLKWLNPLHYWRLLFGDKRGTFTLTKVYKTKTYKANKNEYLN